MYTFRNRLFLHILPMILTASLFLQPALAANQPQVPADWSSPFSDVKSGQWFYPFVAALNSEGVIHGYDNGCFGPNDTTRAGDAMIMILKAAGSGALFEDIRFRANVQGASNAGLNVGVYFFSQATTPAEAREEAEFLLELVEDYNITGPVAFDWENITYDTARTDNVDNETLTSIANTFCQTIAEAGHTPMIYFNQYLAYLRYDLSALTQYPFWLAQYEERPSFRYHFHMWQYSESGQVEGIQGNVGPVLAAELLK